MWQHGVFYVSLIRYCTCVCWGYLLGVHCKVFPICTMVSHVAAFMFFLLGLVSFSLFVFILDATVETSLGVLF